MNRTGSYTPPPLSLRKCGQHSLAVKCPSLVMFSHQAQSWGDIRQWWFALMTANICLQCVTCESHVLPAENGVL